jgi:hypothetical protein
MLRSGCLASDWVRIAALVAACAASARADAPRLCWEDLAGLAAPARASLVRELRALLPGLDVERGTAERPCDREPAIRLAIHAVRQDAPDDALGLAHTRAGRIEPRLEVFVAPVMRLTGAADWEVVGRALARVAAHEAIHYIQQRADHDDHGLFSAHLTAEGLTRRERPTMHIALARLP